MVTIDSLQEVVSALFDGIIADPPTTYRLATIGIQGHPKPMIFMSFENQYVTFY